MEERPLLALELPAINWGLLAASLNTDFDFSFDVLSANHFLLFVALISQVLELLLGLFSLRVIAVDFILFVVIVFILAELLQKLNVLKRGVLVERVAAVMHYEDLSLQVDDVVVVEGPVRIEDEGLHLSRALVVPQLTLVDGPATVEEHEAAHVRVGL